MAQFRPVTMADLARIAGVSSTTVSLSLSHSPKIPDETRNRILAIARKHGYHPNPYVSALMRYRRKRVAVEHPVALALITLDAEFLEKILLDLGLRVPSDIGLASLGCAEVGDRFSGVCQLGHKKGAAAMDVLVGLVERNETGLPEQPITTLVEGRWNPGRTLREPARVAAGAH